MAPNRGIVALETVVAPVGMVPTRLKRSLPGITLTVARRSVSISPECVIAPPLPPAWLTDARANAVLTSTTSPPPKRCVTPMGIVSSLMRLNASPEPKPYDSKMTPVRATVFAAWAARTPGITSTPSSTRTRIMAGGR